MKGIKMTYSYHILPRTRTHDIKLMCELLAETTTKENEDWSTCTRLYRTESGKYMLGIQYHTRRQNEDDVNRVIFYETAAEMLAAWGDSLSDSDKEILKQAAEKDSAFAGSWETEEE